MFSAHSHLRRHLQAQNSLNAKSLRIRKALHILSELHGKHLYLYRAVCNYCWAVKNRENFVVKQSSVSHDQYVVYINLSEHAAKGYPKRSTVADVIDTFPKEDVNSCTPP
ncbi:uncharacterized protein EURHEDRAFT_417911 [Aspergillus ruber CBS 135680]|uniref:Uncharacterized protein n=1 Tax=Aspergillus ruber (strain CBS 135680) TaxID=1388766 RepID=A0A017S029_ASPRC|nr:uncharacterized protein EURHEDRAFT_417911 [Aspergillus ruber CBS 135680]EYE89984.1 hypothetical protein EURHEDRAFT_417911 [Aspergillus ruber CBS 135680]